MKNLKLTAGESVRVRTPQGDIVIEVAPQRVTVQPGLNEVVEPPQTLYYIVGSTSDGVKSTEVMDVQKVLRELFGKSRIDQLRAVIAVDDAKVSREASEQNLPMDCTCGTCGKSFADLYPSARCPYEYVHPEIAELQNLLETRDDEEDDTSCLRQDNRMNLQEVQP